MCIRLMEAAKAYNLELITNSIYLNVLPGMCKIYSVVTCIYSSVG